MKDEKKSVEDLSLSLSGPGKQLETGRSFQGFFILVMASWSGNWYMDKNDQHLGLEALYIY